MMVRLFVTGTAGLVVAAAALLVADHRGPATCNGRPATVVGTSGIDDLIGTAGPDVIVGRAGSDVVTGLGGDDVLCGGGGADWLRGGEDRDLLDGGPDGDQLDGGLGIDAHRATPADGDAEIDVRADVLVAIEHVVGAGSSSGLATGAPAP